MSSTSSRFSALFIPAHYCFVLSVHNITDKLPIPGMGGISTCLLNHSKLIILLPEKRSIKSKKHSIGSCSGLCEGILSQSNSFRINYLGFSSTRGDIIRTGPQWFYLLAHLHKSIKTCQKRQLFAVTHSVSADGEDINQLKYCLFTFQSFLLTLCSKICLVIMKGIFPTSWTFHANE